MLHNPTDKVFEVMSGGTVYIFQPRQSRILQGETARQIQRNQNTPLIVVEAVANIPDEVKEEPVSDKAVPAVDYSKMTYAEMRSIATAKGIFKVGMKGKALLELLNGQR